MSCSSALKWCFVLILLLSVAWKIAIIGNQDDLNGSVTEFFERNRFSTVVTDRIFNGTPIIEANKASCHLKVATLTQDGSDQELLRSLTVGSTDRVLIIFKGRVYRQQPVLWTVLDYHWSKLLRELGFKRYIIPTFAVVANSHCDAERIPMG